MPGRDEITHKVDVLVGKTWHKGYSIEAKAEKLESGKWSFEVKILKGTSSKSVPPSVVETFPTRDEAIEHGFEFCRQAIDGNVPGCFVDF